MNDRPTAMFRGRTDAKAGTPRRNGLTNRIMILTACCVAISTLALGVISYLKIRSEADAIAQISLRAEVQLLSQRFYRDYYLIANDLETIAQTPPIQGLIRSLQNGGVDPRDGSTTELWRTRMATIFQAVLRGRKTYFQFRYITVDDNGRELVRVDRTMHGLATMPEEQLQQKANEPYFLQAMSAPVGKVSFSDVTYNRENGQEDGARIPTLRGMFPVEAPDGTRFGFLVININYETMLQNAFREIAPERHTFVVNDLGDYMEHSVTGGQTSHRLELHDNLTRPVPAVLRKVISSNEDGLFQTAETVGYYVRQDGDFGQASANLGVFIAVPKQQYYASANRTGLEFLLLGLMLIGASTMIATFIARRLMQPLSTLTNTVRFSGPDDRLDELPTDRNDEIGELAAAIQSRNIGLIEGRKRANAIINNVVDGLILVNDMGKIVEFNPSCERIFGYSAEEIIGSNVSKLMTEKDAKSHDLYLQRFREGLGGNTIDILRELEAVDKGGRVFPIELAINVVHVNGKTKYSGVIRDISERKEIERLRGEFVSTVSHELRTPLTSIRGSLSLIETMATKELPPKVHQLISMAQKNTERLIVLVNDILDFEKLRSNKTQYDFKQLDLNEEVRKAIELNQGYADDAGITLIAELVPTQLLVSIDPGKFQQILSNLISNAVKFSNDEGRVLVRTGVSGQRARIEIKDQGEGIPDAFKALVFQPFSQADGGPTRRQNGTGLGLNIAKRLVDGMHGEIDFTSVTGEGTVFWIEFPLQNLIKVSGGISTSIFSENRVRALHLEDDTDFHIVLGTGLDGDLDLIHARSLAEAKSLVEQHSFDLVIIDRMVKDGEGLDLINHIPHPERTKIVVVTAKDENVHHINVDEILVKSRTRPGEFVNRFAVIVDEIKAKKRCA